MTKKIVITGAAGFVGQSLLPELMRLNYKITTLVKNNAEKDQISHFKTKVIEGDLATDSTWQHELDNNTIIIHLAAEIASKSSQAFVKNNVIATKKLITAAKKAKVVKIIHFSSAAVTSIRLDDYARTKKEQEELIVKSKIPFFVLRPSMMYGPGDNKNIGWLIKMCKSLPVIPLPGGGNFGRQPVYIGDINKIVIGLIKHNVENKIYEIHGYEYITLKQMISEIKRQFKIRKIMVPIPILVLKAAIFVQQLVLPNPKFTSDQIESLTSGEKFKGDDWAKLFGIIPTKFSQGVKRMAESC